MKNKEALCTLTGKIMSVKEVAEHENHVQIKKYLVCATPACNARLSFIASSGKADHFRRIKHSEHTEACHLKTEEDELKEKKRSTETIAVSLDDKMIRRKIIYLFNKTISEKTTIEKPASGKKNKVVTANTTEVETTSTILGNSEDTPFEDVKKRGKAVGPVIQTRELNQISASDEGAMVNVHAYIKKIKKTGKGFELEIFKDKHKATMVITEAFIKGSKDTQIPMYLTSLIKFMDNKVDKDFFVSVLSICMVEQYEKDDIVLFVNDFNMFYLSVSEKMRKPIKLDAFQATLIRKNLN